MTLHRRNPVAGLAQHGGGRAADAAERAGEESDRLAATGLDGDPRALARADLAAIGGRGVLLVGHCAECLRALGAACRRLRQRCAPARSCSRSNSRDLDPRIYCDLHQSYSFEIPRPRTHFACASFLHHALPLVV